MLNELLSQVHKPGRYIGSEWNVPRKNFDQARIKFALCFPDLYELGMSNLGLRIIYGLLNNIDGVVCERLFAPALDMENTLRGNKRDIFSLESKRPLREFDLIGFSLGYELCYSNVLNILELGNIPLRSSQRDSSYPLIIGGGPCTLNPEPMHEFFDLFVIGEAEDVILEIIKKYEDLKGLNKGQLFAALSEIEGVYVPSLGVPKQIKKRFVINLDNSFFPRDWVVPYIQIIHDRITLEIMRGCPNRCRFCQARSQYFPLRMRSKDTLLNLADETYRRSGYEEISLCGLSVSDCPHIEGTLKELIDHFKDKAVSISLPSIKPKDMVGNLSYLISTIKKTGLTFAPEVGTAKMRELIGKDFDLEIFWKALTQAYQNGYQHIKLYFMIGLPFEDDSDLDGILALANEVSQLRRKINKAPALVNVSVNTLIPKPHTAFQWFRMQDLEGIKAKQSYIKGRIKNKRLRFSFHNNNMSILEGVFSRGDRRLAKVVYNAFKKGARFDAWDEHFRFDKWLEAFAEAGVDYKFYLEERSFDGILPWDFIDTGVNKQLLRAEANKVIAIK